MITAQTRPERAQAEISQNQARSQQINNSLKSGRDSGKPLSKGKFVAGKQHGKWEVLAEDGSVAQTVQLDKGKLVKVDGRAPKKDEKEAFYADSFAEAPYVIEGHDEGGHLGEDGW